MVTSLVCIPPQESVSLMVYMPPIRLLKIPVLLVAPTPIGLGATIEYLNGLLPKNRLLSETLPLFPLSQVTSKVLRVNLGSL